jgi:hypothetical protein
MFALVAWASSRVPAAMANRAGRLDTGYDVFVGSGPALDVDRLCDFRLEILLSHLPGHILFAAQRATGLDRTHDHNDVALRHPGLMLGVMAEYLHRILLEAKGRPLYFVASRTLEFQRQVGNAAPS